MSGLYGDGVANAAARHSGVYPTEFCSAHGSGDRARQRARGSPQIRVVRVHLHQQATEEVIRIIAMLVLHPGEAVPQDRSILAIASNLFRPSFHERHFRHSGAEKQKISPLLRTAGGMPHV